MSSIRSLDVRGALVALLLAALWGGNPVVVKLGLADAPPLRLAAMRFALGGLTILAWALWTRRSGLLRLRPGEGRVIASLGLIFAVQIGLMNVGLDLTTASHGAVLLNSYAIHTVVLAHFFVPGDRMSAAKIGGIAIAYAGILVLFGRDLSFSSGTVMGDVVVMVSAFLLGERTVYTARAVQRFDPVKLLLGQAAIGTACFLVASFWLERAEPTRYTWSLAASLLYQGPIVAGFNFIVNAWQLQVYRPSALAACALTSPLWGVLLAGALARDPLTPGLLASSGMVVAGMWLATRR